MSEPMGLTDDAGVWATVMNALRAYFAPRTGDATAIEVRDYAADFNALWLPGHHQELRDDAVLICWNGYPDPIRAPEDRNTYEPHLTPYHWALVDACRRSSLDPRRKPRTVWVLHGPAIFSDVWRAVNRNARLIRSMALENQKSAWLLGFSLPPLDMVGDQQLLSKFEVLLTKAAALRSGKTAPSGGASEFDLPADLKGVLEALLLQGPSAGHAVANAVGPLVLSECLGVGGGDQLRGPGGEPPARAALSELLTATGMAPRREKAPSTSDVSGEHAGPLRPAKQTHCLLDDEQAFQQVLRDALAPSALCEKIDVSHLLAGLKTAAAECAPLNVPFDVLWLDLRLWPDNDSLQRADVLREVLKLERQVTNGANAVPSDHWFERVEEASKSAKVLIDAANASSADDHRSEFYENELRAMTLLPLLLSRADPSLPIVIFSSTRQREIDKRLRICPNIVLDFAKPTVGHIAASARALREDFYRAQRSAEQLAALRPLWKRIAYLGSDGHGQELLPPIIPRAIRVRFKQGHTRYSDAKWILGPTETKQRLKWVFALAARADLRAMMPTAYQVLEEGYSSAHERRELEAIDILWDADASEMKIRLARALQEVRTRWVRGLAHHENPAHEEETSPWACAALLWTLLEVILSPSDDTRLAASIANKIGSTDNKASAPDTAFIADQLRHAIGKG